MLEYRLNNRGLKIYNSYTIKDRSEMIDYLLTVRELHSGDKIFENRTIESMVKEWRGHNFLYELNLFVNKTKDVDLDKNELEWYMSLGYAILSAFYSIVRVVKQN